MAEFRDTNRIFQQLSSQGGIAFKCDDDGQQRVLVVTGAAYGHPGSYGGHAPIPGYGGPPAHGYGTHMPPNAAAAAYPPAGPPAAAAPHYPHGPAPPPPHHPQGHYPAPENPPAAPPKR